jgi:hypothetical protein
VHKVPKYPLLHNGVVYDPRDIVRFNGRALLYIVDGTVPGNILIVDDPETIRSILIMKVVSRVTDTLSSGIAIAESKAVPPTRPPMNPPLGPQNIGGPELVVTPPRPGGGGSNQSSDELRLFSSGGFGGAELDLKPGLVLYDLTDVYIFWPSDDWNDEINSMLPTSSTGILNEHVNFTGSFLLLPQNMYVYDLGDYGWDARASAICNYG